MLNHTQPVPINTLNLKYQGTIQSTSPIPENILKVLILEDNDNDAELIQMYLKSSAFKVESTIVSTKEDYIKNLKDIAYDVILSDHNLPQFSSREALKIRNEIKFQIPFILVSGAIPEEYAVTILQEGANDYILKDRPQRLMSAITEAIRKQKAISDKIVAEQELAAINERLRLVGKATSDAIWDWNLITNELVWGEGFEILFGYKLSGLTPDITSWTEHVSPEDKERVEAGIKKVISGTSTIWTDEYGYLKADGTVALVMDKGIVLRDEDGKAYRMVGAMQDITHIRQLETEINQQKINYQKQNTEIAIQSQEEERKNIGVELHDNINQLMASAKMMINTARKSPEIHDICIEKGYESIDLAMEEVRKLSHRLVPPVFTEDNSFIDAINKIVSDIQLSGTIDIKVSIPTNGKFKLSNEKIKLTFYRIIQEQLNNILKYAKASRASISLILLKNAYQLTVEDNGVGFDTEHKANGIGLRNITSRAELLSGTVEITSAPGKGCSLKVEIPF